MRTRGLADVGGEGAAADEPIGRWVLLGEQSATPEVMRAIDAFDPLENNGGREAGSWLRDKALGQDGLTRTHLLLDESGDRLLGFFACCYSQVRLTKKSILGLRLRTTRTVVPAFLLCWIARSQEDRVGLDLMATAYGLAQEAAENVGLVAFVLDPMDEAVASLWKRKPYFFQESATRSGSDGPPRLWLPI